MNGARLEGAFVKRGARMFRCMTHAEDYITRGGNLSNGADTVEGVGVLPIAAGPRGTKRAGRR